MIAFVIKVDLNFVHPENFKLIIFIYRYSIYVWFGNFFISCIGPCSITHEKNKMTFLAHIYLNLISIINLIFRFE